MPKLNIIIKGGTVFDGIRNEGFLADVGIRDGKVVKIGHLSDEQSDQVVYAQGKYVCPGFIDIQNHSDIYFTLLEFPSQESLVRQGITTIAVGHCGASLAPLAGKEAIDSIQKWHSLAGSNINWSSMAEYLENVNRYPLGVNVVSLVGHSTVRRGVVGEQIREATAQEIKIMNQLIRTGLHEGAAGLSLGLVYAHEAVASLDELSSASRIVAEEKKLLSIHLRSESAHIVTAISEAIDLAEKSGARLKISHFKIRGKDNWSFLEEALQIMDTAYQKGVKIRFDVYPYDTSWTVLYTYLPKWAYEGGREQLLLNLKNGQMRQRMIAHLKGSNLDLDSITIASAPTNPNLVGRTLKQVAANQEISVEEALLNMVAATNAQVVAFDYNLSLDNLLILLRHPLSLVSSDGAGYDFSVSQNLDLVHPRCFGTMPRFLKMVRERSLMSWSEAIKKITSFPAEHLGLKDRGYIKEGFVADLVIFDPLLVDSHANYQNPFKEPEGIDHVIVNGNLAYASHLNVLNRLGRVLLL